MTPTLYALAGAVLLSSGLGFGLYKSIQHNGEITAELDNVKQERDDAKVKEAAAAEATRKQRTELDRLRRQSSRESSAVRKASDDCLDRRTDPAIDRALRMLPEDGKAKPPRPSAGP